MFGTSQLILLYSVSCMSGGLGVIEYDDFGHYRQ